MITFQKQVVLVGCVYFEKLPGGGALFPAVKRPDHETDHRSTGNRGGKCVGQYDDSRIISRLWRSVRLKTATFLLCTATFNLNMRDSLQNLDTGTLCMSITDLLWHPP
jgi:hypothetical protein